MKDYKRLKRNLKLFFSLITILLLTIDISVIVSVLVNGTDGWIVIYTILGTFIFLPISIILFNKLYFKKKRIEVIKEVFNSFEHDKLVYTRKKHVSGEALEELNMINLANEFYVSSVIDGTYNGVKVLAFSADYTKTGLRKDQKLMRVYTFEFNNEIKKNYQFREFDSFLLDDSTLNKHIKVSKNKLYLSYANPISKLNYQLEPLAFKDYESFKKRYSDELTLIRNVCNRVNKEFN